MDGRARTAGFAGPAPRSPCALATTRAWRESWQTPMGHRLVGFSVEDGTKRLDPTLNVKMHIPVLVNTKELQCGDELVLYVDPPEKKEIPKSDPKKKALELTLPEPCPKHVRLI